MIAAAIAVLACASSAPGAVLTGKARDGTRYRLDGKNLVVRLGHPVKRSVIRCGDAAGYLGNRAIPQSIFADVVVATARPTHGTRRVQVRFARDISSRVSVCFRALHDDDQIFPGDPREANMRLRSGKSAGCRLARKERMRAVVGAVQITVVVDSANAVWRACRPGDPRPTSLFSDSVGDYDYQTTGPYVVAGDVLAWHWYHEDRYTDFSSVVGATDLATGRRIGAINLQAEASAVAVSSTGVLACIQLSWPSHGAAARVLARRLDGQVLTLDEAPGDSFSELAVSGSTVSWRHDGEPRTASVES
jgi:hypothetical protein